MAGHKYTAKGKVVQKMTKEGLTEENLKDGSSKKVNLKDEEQPKIKQPEFSLERQKKDAPLDENPSTSKRNKKYQNVKSDETRSEPPTRAAPLRFEKDMEDAEPEKPTRVQKRNLTKDAAETDAEQTAEGDVSNPEQLFTQSSARMEGVRERSGRTTDAVMKGIAEEKHIRKKKMVQDYARKKGESAKEETLDDFREDIDKKSKREQVIKEQRKKGRLAFDDEESGMVKGSGMSVGKRAAEGAAIVASGYAHGKVHDVEEENSAVEAVHKSELLAEDAARSLRHAQNRRKKNASYSEKLKEGAVPNEAKGRLSFSSAEGAKEAENVKATANATQEAAKKNSLIKRFWQKRRNKEVYEAAKEGKKVAETVKVAEGITVKARRVAKEILKRNSGILAGLGIFALLFGMVAASLTSCSALFQGSGTTIIGTTYAATDEDIYAVENAYCALEAALNEQINSMESRQDGYDEYRYQIDEISHNPYHLISYFTVKYGEFTYEQVAGELEEIFREQYGISTDGQQETVTETKTVRVGESLGQVVTSGYCNCSICCGQWSGGPTASGVYPTPNHTIAVDAANPFVPMGTKVVMNGVEYTVEDTGNFAQYGVQFDVYYGDHTSASNHGHKTWDAYIADDNGNQEVEVTVTKEVNRLNVTTTNHNLDTVLRARMNDEEEERYDLYNKTYGNRNYLFDLNSLPYYGNGGFGYDIPAEALSDERFARMIREAEKYLGYPYVWGGASPSTSFDCSGFVSWVINNCGNGWSVGRQTADGLRGCCAQVSPSQAKPGDLIFFQGTYDTPGASHVGIYVGDGMMIHCGNPIQYASIQSTYWQQHFMAFGRLP